MELRQSSKEIIIMQSQLDDWKLRMARTKEAHDRQDAERAELERELRAKADLEAAAPEKRQEEFRQRAMTTVPVSFGAVEARTQAALDKAQREKDERLEEIKFLGRVIAEELGPVLAAAIAKAFKDNQPSAQLAKAKLGILQKDHVKVHQALNKAMAFHTRLHGHINAAARASEMNPNAIRQEQQED
jgi:HSP90 family molecular chaperone